MQHQPLGEILIDQGAVTKAQLREVRRDLGQIPEQELGREAIHRGWITVSDVAKALSIQSGRDYVPPAHLHPHLDVIQELSRATLMQLGALPIRSDEAHTFAIADPGDLSIALELERMVGDHIHIVVTDADVIGPALQGRYIRDTATHHTDNPRDRRSSRRIHIADEIRIEYAFLGPEQEQLFGRIFLGELRDISRGGAALAGGLPHPEGEQGAHLEPGTAFHGKLTCRELSGEKPVRLGGEVRWVKWDAKLPYLGSFGVDWHPTAAWDQACMKALLLREHQLEAEGEGSA